jgi:hypothetical protein
MAYGRRRIDGAAFAFDERMLKTYGWTRCPGSPYPVRNNSGDNYAWTSQGSLHSIRDIVADRMTTHET